MTGAITVHSAGFAVVTDLGRLRGPSLGLPANGALDQYSACVGNILVANQEQAPIIEVTAFDFRFATDTDLLIAVTGAPMTVLIDGIEHEMWQPIAVRAGQTVALEEMTAGLRAYIAVHGSFEVPLLLGSCAPDPGVGFGTVLEAGSTVALARAIEPIATPYFDMSLFNLGVLVPHIGGTATIDVTDGPDADQFAGTADRLFRAPFTVTARSNHIGLRLTGELPIRRSTEEIVSRGVPVGAVEVPPGDELLVLHRGRGVTAGYPVLAVATPLALDDLGQVRPGQQVRFRRSTVEQAAQNSRRWRSALDHLRSRIAAVYSCLGLERLLHPGVAVPPAPAGPLAAEGTT